MPYLVLDDRDRVITVHSDSVPGKGALVDYILAAIGINVKQVLEYVPNRRADKVEQGKLTLTSSLLAAPGTNIQEVAGDVQMIEVLINNLTPSKRPRAEGKLTLTSSFLAAPGTNMQEVAGDVQMTEVLKNNLTPSKRPRAEDS
ncbi:uncharacterized protein [Medicago truncatula]|uniref:uncharacterized protein isoform X1 n=1 Tax=Medicago truncatula TaxID=3880 RepID=UPI001967E278|nr:uncharacterized protein LOC112417576 isoform X1 [Medicago truncatula]